MLRIQFQVNKLFQQVRWSEETTTQATLKLLIAEDDKSGLFRETVHILETLPRKRVRFATAERDFLSAMTDKVARTVLPKQIYNQLDEYRSRQRGIGGLETHQNGAGSTIPDDSAIGMPVIEKTDKVAVKRSKGAKILRKLSELGVQEAHEVLGNMYLFGKYQHPRNALKAFDHYHILSQDFGSPSGQRMVGLMYATGVGVERDYAKALLYLSFASIAGDTVAEQVLGYWHIMGIATPQNCDEAAYYYKNVAEKAVARYKSGPPGGLTMPLPRLRLPDQDGGIYGYGASGPSDPTMRTGPRANQGGALSTEDMLQYHRLQADDGDAPSQVLFGHIFYTGSFDVKQNFRRAMDFFRAAASQYPGAEAVNAEDAPESLKATASAAAQAMHFLGQMYWRGEGVQQNNITAREWFEKGAVDKNPACLNALAIMLMEGIGGVKVTSTVQEDYAITNADDEVRSMLQDYKKGTDFLKIAASKDNADAQARLGELCLEAGPKEYPQALKWFKAASKSRNIIALYHLGNMYMQGVGVSSPNCNYAVMYYKSVAETGDWHDPIVHAAQDDYKAGDMEGAFVRYLFAAERGYEVAQTNAAWMIDQGTYKFRTSNLVPDRSASPHETALVLWNRAANQGNVNARVKMGDYYFYGLGTHPNSAPQAGSDFSETVDSTTAEKDHTALAPRGDPVRAAIYYFVAADTEWSSIAMWNLGWMHETGLGVDQDYHLAKRFYDRCLETNPEAYLPVRLALAKLRVKMFAEYLLAGGPFSSSSGAPPSQVTPSTATPATAGQAGADIPLDQVQQPHLQSPHHPAQQQYDDDDDDDAFWSGRRHHAIDEDGQGSAEGIAIMFLCAVAAGLVIWRQQIQQQQQRAAAQAAQAAAPVPPQAAAAVVAVPPLVAESRAARATEVEVPAEAERVS
ncbi:ERAD-associated protein, partial [Thoreauomyces humboldtii]